MNTTRLAEHFFRHEYGRVLSMLCRRVGARHIEAVEDAVQGALMAGLESWPQSGLPDNPSAWLFRVAFRRLAGELRQRARRDSLIEQHAADAAEAAVDPPGALLVADVHDDLLRMLFVCCDGAIPVESQLVLALKTLGGFDVREIAERLFSTEASIYKRLERARNRLAQVGSLSDELSVAELDRRRPAVQSILYLMFTEGYLSSGPEAIRRELCNEAKRLALLLAQHPLGATHETFALVALMHLHAARLDTRQDARGDLLLLEEQDRARWDRHEIATGLSWLAKSAGGSEFTRYHAEAGIAAEHALAPSLAQTRWDRIVACYDLLERVAPSPLHRLGRALAVAEQCGAAEGLAALEPCEPPAGLGDSYLWFAVLADLHRRCGHAAAAASYDALAIERAPSPAMRELLGRRLGDQDGLGCAAVSAG